METVKDLIGDDLKDNLDKYVFNKIIEFKDQFPYISDSSIKSLVNYLGNKKDLKLSKDLWKNLIIDSICILKINDRREQLYSDFESNKGVFVEKFEKIRKSSSYGIDEISIYFDDFVKFESVLYGTDDHYRDHVGHVLKVWAIGISLLDFYEFKFNDGYLYSGKHNFHFELRIKKSLSISKSERWAMWTIIALCHDLGYPIEKTSKINNQAKKIITHFGSMNFSELNYNFGIFNTFLVEKFLNIISSKAIFKQRQTAVQTKFKDKISKSLEEYKHGIFSSLLIFKKFTYFLETDIWEINDELSEEDLRQFYIRKEILRSIAGHTCPKIYHLELNSLAFLLILCDELQEWDRPKFDDLRNDSLKDEPKVKILNFQMGVEQKVHLELNYNFPSSDNYVKHLVISRFKNIHNLLRSAKDDNKRKIFHIYFKWEIIFSNEKYSFCFDSNKYSFELLETKKHLLNNAIWVEDIEPFDIYKEL